MWDLLQNVLDGGVAARVLMVLLDSGAKGLLLLAAAGLATAVLRRKAAAARHLVWMLALGGLLLLPVVSLLMPKWSLPLLPAVETTETVAQLEAATPYAPPAAQTSEQATSAAPEPLTFAPTTPTSPPETFTATKSTLPVAAPSTISELSGASIPVALWLVMLWLVVAVLCAFPFVLGVALVARLRRTSPRYPDDAVQALGESLGRALGMRRNTPILRGASESMPMAVGIFRTAVFLPAETASWGEEKTRVVLLHELAHVKRRDCLTHAIARVAVSLHWFNPLAWLALRQLRIEREHACDDLVLATGERPSAYAENLLEIARTLRAQSLVGAAAVTMAQRSQLEGRLLAVLDAARNRGRVTKRLVTGSTFTALLVLGLLSAVEVARTESEARRYKLEFTSGIRATLVGVAEAANEGNAPVWEPEGAPLDARPTEFQGLRSRGSETSDSTPRELLVIFSFPTEFTDHDPIGIKPRSGSFGTDRVLRPGTLQVAMSALADAPTDEDTFSLEFGVAAGPWQTAADTIFGNSIRQSAGGVIYETMVSFPYKRDGKTAFLLTYFRKPVVLGANTSPQLQQTRLQDQDVRVVVTNAEGKDFPTHATNGTVTDLLFQKEFILDGIAPDDVDNIRLQVRDYEWQTFEGIALHPGSNSAADDPPGEAPVAVADPPTETVNA